jgi:hypothetical protein
MTMMAIDEWREHNDAYLSTALRWLRLKLAAGKPDDAARAAVEHAGGELRRAERSAPPPAMIMLRETLGLSRFEHDVLMLCAAMELDTRVGPLCAQAHDDPRKPYPTFALAMSVFDAPEWGALSPSGPLRYWRLVEVEQVGATPLTFSALRADERIVHFIKGLNTLDERLLSVLSPLAPAGDLPPSQQAIAGAVARAWLRAASGVLQLAGVNRASNRAVAAEAARQARAQLYALSPEALPTNTPDVDRFARLWQRETKLLPVALFIDAHDTEITPARAEAIRRVCDGCASPMVLSAREVCSDLSGVSSIHDVSTPAPDEQRALWQAAFEDGERGAERMIEASTAKMLEAGTADIMSAQFDFDGSEIARIAAQSRDRAGPPERARVWANCLAISRPQLDALAQRLVPRATWDDIVLNAEATRLMRAIADQARHRSLVYDNWGWRARMNRGLGITALFAGESGTGKTMAAEVLASDLRLDLYRIDLSSVVSKYIGETEKNMRRLFDAAEHGGAILFFDEADALFGKRSEVKDSHDRYANIEVNYLLQRMESYRGIAILATNMKSALDPAFMRRLRFVVNFAFPGPSERKRMWAGAFPRQTPARDLDFDRLARLNLSGALIHAIALNAAFIAAARAAPVTMDGVLDAARMELRKLDRATNEVEAV